MSALRSMETSHKPLSILRCKVVVVGDACVGKTSLTQVFQSGGLTYPKAYLMTIGAEFCVKQVPIPDTNYIVELFIYDCAGQSIFNQLDFNSKYYTDAAAVVVVYSVASRESLQSTTKWLQSVRGALSNGPAPIGVLVGNKTDLRDGTVDSRAEVTHTEAKNLAAGLGLHYFESSAQSNQGVEEPFKFIAEDFLKKYEESGQSVDDFNRSYAL